MARYTGVDLQLKSSLTAHATVGSVSVAPRNFRSARRSSSRRAPKKACDARGRNRSPCPRWVLLIRAAQRVFKDFEALVLEVAGPWREGDLGEGELVAADEKVDPNAGLLSSEEPRPLRVPHRLPVAARPRAARDDAGTSRVAGIRPSHVWVRWLQRDKTCYTPQ